MKPDMAKMDWRCLTLWQPYASLIPLGVKKIETRSRRSHYRGKLAIHSALSHNFTFDDFLRTKADLMVAANKDGNNDMIYKVDKLNYGLGSSYFCFPKGFILATADMVDCVEITGKFIDQQSQIELAVGDWQIGRFAYILENINPVNTPISVNGGQGMRLLDRVVIEQLKIDYWLWKN